MTGALEEGGKAIGNVVDAMRSQPLAIALVLINLGLLIYLYYYTSRITSRTEMTAQALFTANDKLYAQFGVIVKDQNVLVEKAMHCLLPEDAIKLLQLPPRVAPEPARPEPPAPLNQRGDLRRDLKGNVKPVDWEMLQIGEMRPFTFEQPKLSGPPVSARPK